MRIEKDSLGELPIPHDALYGIQSFRASQNFQISSTQVHPKLIETLLLLKKACAVANNKAGHLSNKITEAISSSVNKLLYENYLQHFIIDAYQAGAGTSQNMNANEVIANQANVLLGGKLGSYDLVHPNDHVNMSQSTNDIYPTAMRLATLRLSKDLVTELQALSQTLKSKSQEFDQVIKAGRTHLQDAVPIRLGQEFQAYQTTVDHLIELILHAQDYLRELGIGGSAVGTGINVPSNFRNYVIVELRIFFLDDDLNLADDMCSAMQSQLPMMVYSNALRVCALELTRIVNDLRLLSSGPFTGLGEIILPPIQPGSSIMPGKINPSILEMANQVFFKILGNDQAMAYANQAGQLELNVMMPIMAQSALESTQLFINTLKAMRELCLCGIKANINQCEKFAEQTSQIVTAIVPIIGHVKATQLMKESIYAKKTIIQLIKEQHILSNEQIKNILDLKKLTIPN